MTRPVSISTCPPQRGFALLAGAVFALVMAMGAEPVGATDTITSSLTATGELWQNTAGGLSREGCWNTLVDAVAQIDGPRFGAPKTGMVVAQVHWVANRRSDVGFAGATGAFNAVSGTMASDHVRIFNLHYRQQAPDGERWAFKIGQIAVDDDFMTSDYTRLFANAAFGALPSQVATPLCSDCAFRSAFPIYGVAAPGAWVQLKPLPRTDWQAGIYHGGPGPDSKGNSGFAWTRASHSGVLVFTELTHRAALAGHPLTTHVGAAAHTGRVDSYAAERRGNGRQRTRGIYSVYVVQDAVLLRDGAGHPRVGGFVRAGMSPQRDRSVVTAYTDAGLNWFGPLAARPNDIIGLAFSCTHFGPDFRALNDVAATESTLEATYQARLARRIAVQVDGQLLFNPARNPTTQRRETAAIVGVRTTVSF